MAQIKIDFTGTPDDFVEMVRMFHKVGDCINMQTGQPATREEVAATFMQFMNVDLGGYPDYKTLELCSNGGDLPERVLKALEELRKESKDDKKEEPNIPKAKEDDLTGNSTDT
jgi:hypothetical protein